MPRIAAALGVFVLAACSIGLNMARYPVVWEMVGASPHFSQADQAAQASAAANPAPAAPDATGDSPAATGAPPLPERYTGNMPVAPGVGSPTVPVGPGGQDDGSPAPGSAVLRTLGGERWASQSAPADRNRGDEEPLAQYRRERKPLVPIIVPDALPDPGIKPESDMTVRRLPPVDPARPALNEQSKSAARADPQPQYPSTGIE